jgi:hypothetical protein
MTPYIFIYIAGEAFGATSEEFDEQSENQLGRVILGAHQQERLLQFLDVKLQQIKGLSETPKLCESHFMLTRVMFSAVLCDLISLFFKDFI